MSLEWSVDALGGFLTSPELSRTFRSGWTTVGAVRYGDLLRGKGYFYTYPSPYKPDAKVRLSSPQSTYRFRTFGDCIDGV